MMPSLNFQRYRRIIMESAVNAFNFLNLAVFLHSVTTISEQYRTKSGNTGLDWLDSHSVRTLMTKVATGKSHLILRTRDSPQWQESTSNFPEIWRLSLKNLIKLESTMRSWRRVFIYSLIKGNGVTL